MKDLSAEYSRLLDLQEFRDEELDYAILDRHIAVLSELSKVSNSGITVFDMYKRRHMFVSYNFGELFRYDLSRIESEDVEYFNLQIHPDDFGPLMRNGTICFRHSLELGAEAVNYKLISEYRINLAGKYTRVVEQMQVLELDPRGNKWLSLSVLDVSPGQGPLERVESKMLNFKTGEVFMLPDYPEYREDTVTLTPREKTVLRLVRDGLLSKEISDHMQISVNTVNTYRQRIIEKLDVNNSHEAIRYASRLGLLE
ncbi:response regulator transcription factor [Alistipes sp. OttesenSCG-928-B03]|nr:response regulator transcription factor [Alistipes sp. OttesenSCG-928-B03]